MPGGFQSLGFSTGQAQVEAGCSQDTLLELYYKSCYLLAWETGSELLVQAVGGSPDVAVSSFLF